MARIFNEKAGVASAYHDASSSAQIVLIGPNVTSFTSAVIASIGCNSSVAYQLTKSLANTTYIYIFGDSPDIYILRGILFLSGTCVSNLSGLDDVLNFYNSNKVSNSFSRVSITIGNTTIRGMLVELSTGDVNTATLTMPFTMKLVATDD